MVSAILYLIASLLFMAGSVLCFVTGDIFVGILWMLLAIIEGILSIMTAREER
jgi:hypothetical protein